MENVWVLASVWIGLALTDHEDSIHRDLQILGAPTRSKSWLHERLYWLLKNTMQQKGT